MKQKFKKWYLNLILKIVVDQMASLGVFAKPVGYCRLGHHKVVHTFFQGFILQNSITHINLVLIHRQDVVQFFLDLQTIIVSNFLNKVISKLIHDRLERPLPRLIAQIQSGFIKDRNITKNVLISQEIIFDISLRG